MSKTSTSILNILDLIECVEQHGWSPQLEYLFGDELRENGVDIDGDIPSQIIKLLTPAEEGIGTVLFIAAMLAILIDDISTRIGDRKTKAKEGPFLYKNKWDKVTKKTVVNLQYDTYEFVSNNYPLWLEGYLTPKFCIDRLQEIEKKLNILVNVREEDMVGDILATLQEPSTSKQSKWDDHEAWADAITKGEELPSLKQLGWTYTTIIAVRDNLRLVDKILEATKSTKKIKNNKAFARRDINVLRKIIKTEVYAYWDCYRALQKVMYEVHAFNLN